MVYINTPRGDSVHRGGGITALEIRLKDILGPMILYLSPMLNIAVGGGVQ